MAGISGRSVQSSGNKFRFNEGSEFQSKEFSDGQGLDWYETDYRGYDPQVGQFRQVDLGAELTDAWGVYSFGFNNPVSFNDPLGLTPTIKGEGCKPCEDGHTRSSSSGPEPEYQVLPVVEVVAKVKSKSTLANSAFGWANQIQGSGVSEWRNELYGYQRLREQGVSSRQAGARHLEHAADFERRYQAEQSWRDANFALLDILTLFLPGPKLSFSRFSRSLTAKVVRNPLAASAAKTSTRFVSTAEGVVHDLKPTLDRIASGGKFPHRNDGSIFKNMEGLLPKQNAGYYREFVHPTPGVNGPGAMRVVTGQNGQMWFTPDHYKTFIPIR